MPTPRFRSRIVGAWCHRTWPADAPTSYLVEGGNVLTVQAFDRSLSASTDFRFAAALVVERTDALAPTIAARWPADLLVATLSQIVVVFSEPVLGVAAGDLWINAQPAAQLTGPSGSDTYTFTFTPPPPGTVHITWSEANRIVDRQGNPFSTEAPGFELELHPGRHHRAGGPRVDAGCGRAGEPVATGGSALQRTGGRARRRRFARQRPTRREPGRK